MLFVAFIISLSLSAANTHQKIKLCDDVLDRLNEIEAVYQQCLKAGMKPKDASVAAMKWQDQRYPVHLYPIKESDYKEEGKKESKKKDEK